MGYAPRNIRLFNNTTASKKSLAIKESLVNRSQDNDNIFDTLVASGKK